jgi:hypothetical protein
MTFAFKVHDGIRATIHFPNDSGNATVVMNGETVCSLGKPVKGASRTGRWISVSNVRGECAYESGIRAISISRGRCRRQSYDGL